MRLLSFALLTGLSVLTLAIPSYGQVRTQADSAAVIEAIRAELPNAGTAVAVFSTSEEYYRGYHGFADVASEQTADDNTLYMIGSTTKAMTATVAGFLVQSGQLQWDDLVTTHVPNFKLQDEAATRNATLRDLLLHRTGLPRHDFAWLTRTWTSAEFLELLPLLEPSESFRSTWQYQNLMYMVAGLMVGHAAESDWQTAMQELIFDNLDMKQSRALASQLKPSDQPATPHAWNGSANVAIDPRDIDGVGPAGSVYATLPDMMKWVRFNMLAGQAGEQPLSPSIVSEIHRPQMDTGRPAPYPEFDGAMEYGLGWVVSSYRGHKVIHHGGGIDGFLTDVTFLPEHNLGIIVLTNGGAMPPSLVKLSLLDRFLELEPIDWVARHKEQQANQPVFPDVDFPASYANTTGIYSHPAYGTLVVTTKSIGDAKFINLKLNDGFEFTVNPWLTAEPNLLEYNYAGFLFRVHLNAEGEAYLIEAQLEPKVAPLQFRRAALEAAE